MPRLRLAAAFAAAVLAACSSSGGPSRPAPTADAGADQIASKGELVVLTGTAPGAEGTLAFSWAQTGGTPVAFLGASGAQSVSFVAPRTAGVLTFSLVVTASGVASAPDSVQIVVRNLAPTAAAGPDLTAGAEWWVTLDGRASWDPDGDPLSFTWYQTSGPPVTFVPGPPGTTRFLTPATPAILAFELVVGDGEDDSAADAVQVRVLGPGANWAPSADAGPDLVTPKRAPVRLVGSGSDPDLGIVIYRWEQTAGPPVQLTGASTSSPTFAAPAVSCDLEFTLTVSDGVDSATDAVLVLVRNTPPTVDVAIAPAVPRTADDLAATATPLDADGDVTTLAWAWKRNGSALAGQASALLPASETTRGDVITVVVTASDGEAEASAEASVTIDDTPPVLTASPPASVAAGGSVAFDVTAFDPDGDPTEGALELLHGPAGMTVDAAGHVAWTATLPMFDRSLDVHWAVGLRSAPAAALSGTIRVDDPDRPLPLLRTPTALPSWNGLVAADLDGDGARELLVGSAAGVYELGWSGAGYEQRWAHPFQIGAPSAFSAVDARDVNGDGAPEIFFSAGEVLVALDGATRREVARFDPGGSLGCLDLEVADLGGDGAPEVICLSGDTSSAYSSGQRVVVLDAALAPLWETPALALGATVAVGNVDADPAREIVTAGGFVFDGVTAANQWASSTAFGRAADTGDLDGDGVEEIVGIGDWGPVRGFSAVARSALWEVDAFDLDSLLVADLEGDGVAEIVIGDGQWGDVIVYRYGDPTNPLVSIFSLDHVGHGCTSLAAADLDGDGAVELAWGSGDTLGGADVFVASLSPAAIEWRSGPVRLDGPFLGARPIATDGGTRLVFAVPETNSGYDGTRLVTLDPASGALAVGATELGTNWSGNRALDVADVDGDGVAEALVATASLYDGFLAVHDVARGVTEWTTPVGSVNAAAITHGDLTGDGTADLVAIDTTGSVHVYDVRSQALVWKGTTAAGTGVDVEVADLDGDGVPEIVALHGGRLVAYRRAASGTVPYLEWFSTPMTGGIDLLVADCDGDLAPELYVLASSGQTASIARHDAAGVLLGTLPAPAAPAAIFLEDLGFPRRNLVVASGAAWFGSTARPELRAVDAVSGGEVWRSPELVGFVSRNSLTYVPGPAIAFGTQLGMYLTR